MEPRLLELITTPFQGEFTGERLVPGKVGDDLLNEHLSRYRFARRFLPETGAGRVLDAGCGTGYGSVEFGRDVAVFGLDFSAEALTHACANYARPGIQLVQGSCEELPFADAAFDLIAAFEVIEHLERWPDFLGEASRVLKPGGTLVVSTPNKAYYTESRGTAGPNPFHVHEFEFVEFSEALRSIFPHVRMWTQNHAEAILFAPADPVGVGAEAPGDSAPETAAFFVAVCSHSPIATNDAYVWVPRAGNVLREREHHVRKLEGELATKESWLRDAMEDRYHLQAVHDRTIVELERQNRWAAELDAELASARTTVSGLHREAEERLTWIGGLETQIAYLESEIRLRDEAIEQFKAHVALLEKQRGFEAAEEYRCHVELLENRLGETVRVFNEKVSELEADLVARTAWARSIEAELEIRTHHVHLLMEQIAEHERHLAAQGRELENREMQIAEREMQITNRETRISELQERHNLAAASKWLRLGKRLGLGPDLGSGNGGTEGVENPPPAAGPV